MRYCVTHIFCRKRGGKKEANKFLSSEDKRDKVQEMSVRNEMFDDDVVDSVEPPVNNNKDLRNLITDDEEPYANNECKWFATS